MVCFIILHYMVKDETISCIESIKTLDGESKVIIVDNGSSNRSGEQLKKLYESDPDITVYINTLNFGFAQGNNIGCQIAKKKYDPNFYIVMNNDIEICQKDFISKIEQLWQQEQFHVLGPDIYSTTNKVHQSPKTLENMTIERARNLHAQYEKKLHSQFIVPLRCYLKQIKPLKILYNQAKNNRLHIDFQKKYYNVPLHGACFIFSKEFIDRRRNAFFPGTFFYFESEILDYECQKNGLKEVYDPSLKVLHHQNVSTNTIYKNVLKKVKFMNEQNYHSIDAFLKAYDRA